jgi:Na+-driven multidrug efflux pump
LCPILISGWLTGHPLGVVGAGLATSVSVALGVLLMFLYFHRLERYVVFNAALMSPIPKVWKRVLKVGLPPGGEFALMFVFMGVVYWVIRGFGAEAQAGYGIGSRVMQSIFLPAMAIAFATAPVAGQNMGALKFDRVRETFKVAVIMLSCIMFGLTVFCQFRPDLMIAFFSDEAPVIAAGAEFLQIISLTFVASGIIFTCSGMFQALGNTMPSLVASASRLISFVIPAVWMSSQPWFELPFLWYTSVVTVFVQAVMAWVLMAREMRRKLSQGIPGLAPVSAEPPPT